MFLSLTDFFSDEAAIVQVNSSDIDVSAFENDEDKSFLVAHGSEILRISAKAEFAKEKIIKAIDQKAEDAKGQHIYEIQERFRSNPELKGGLLRYFHSLGFWDKGMAKLSPTPLEKPETYTSLESAFRWANAYRAALEMQEKLGGLLTPEEIQERTASVSSSALARVYTSCSETDRESIYQHIVTGGGLSYSEAEEMTQKPEVQLNKAKEQLEDAKARKAEAEEKCERRAELNADQAIRNFEDKIAKLEAELEAKGSELQKFKFDDELRRQQRVKALSASLTISVPQVLADISKYTMEPDAYPDQVRSHLNDQIKMLADLCGDYLAKV